MVGGAAPPHICFWAFNALLKNTEVVVHSGNVLRHVTTLVAQGQLSTTPPAALLHSGLTEVVMHGNAAFIRHASVAAHGVGGPAGVGLVEAGVVGGPAGVGLVEAVAAEHKACNCCSN